VESVDVEGLVGPLALQTQLAPGADVLLRAARPVGAEVGPRPAAVAGRAEHAVELFEGDALERVVVVDEDHRRVFPARDVVRAGDGGDLERVEAHHALVCEQVVEPRPVAALFRFHSIWMPGWALRNSSSQTCARPLSAR